MIRKISIGLDLKNTMAFFVGQELFKSYIVDTIRKNDDGSYSLYLKKDGEIVLWKNFNKNLPITLEYNINF